MSAVANCPVCGGAPAVEDATEIGCGFGVGCSTCGMGTPEVISCFPGRSKPAKPGEPNFMADTREDVVALWNEYAKMRAAELAALN